MGTRGFINGEQGIKSKKIKGSWEHVPPPGRGSLVHKPGFSFNSLRFQLVVLRIKQKTLKKSECETLTSIHCANSVTEKMLEKLLVYWKLEEKKQISIEESCSCSFHEHGHLTGHSVDSIFIFSFKPWFQCRKTLFLILITLRCFC